MPGSPLDDILPALANLGLDTPQRAACYGTLVRILGNIRDDPTENKYHTIKKSAKVLQNSLCDAHTGQLYAPVIGILREAGFKETVDSYVWDPSSEEQHETLIDAAERLEDLHDALKAAQSTQPSATGSGTLGKKPTGGHSRQFALRTDVEKKRLVQEQQMKQVKEASRDNHSTAESFPLRLEVIISLVDASSVAQQLTHLAATDKACELSLRLTLMEYPVLAIVPPTVDIDTSPVIDFGGRGKSCDFTIKAEAVGVEPVPLWLLLVLRVGEEDQYLLATGCFDMRRYVENAVLGPPTMASFDKLTVALAPTAGTGVAAGPGLDRLHRCSIIVIRGGLSLPPNVEDQ
ncbi:hypothetical protein Pmar_PMAR013674 [Perkinsus marinus ATCC 50983]|uniref:PUB domain-containing protein n=1 Tax=Perkinsus marinus (strain ATCC 50983 / TXsc) TaxID=423536 RepID=C5LXZ7_PERM5|nr:hypothetical protein Pmar_PMAR013674 [Perkinsus marinus ATCC 50983]EEQ98327.1 hypothetical protein Pmar_PMAR013674 [Perkinsus marinus ATCC 50983]|eukprot:XP_002765610.1 hypothetical protein Pmar_PMAR013674 [Perkinsus marinus ATCC 50983]